jgi:hypothetical protein
MAEQEKANLFFGVCPRYGGKRLFDMAWQIRTVRALWADLDFCATDEALERCRLQDLPTPSAVVRSGNGVHLYWFLTQPYQIDDAGVPPPVYTEFVESSAGKQRPRRFLLGPNDQKIYELPGLSAKGRHAQEVLAGIAARLGGDHTQDLSRLLRLPGTLNRKNERNGRPPVPCELAECHADRRYSFATFERFAAAAPRSVKPTELAKVRLPAGKKLTATRLNRLADFVNSSALAELGQRSQRDFALCCHCLRQGYDKEAIWTEVQQAGKFGERGRGGCPRFRVRTLSFSS